MNVVTVNEAKRNLDLLIAKVVASAEPTIITTDTGQEIVLLRLDEFNAWQETAYLLSNHPCKGLTYFRMARILAVDT